MTAQGAQKIQNYPNEAIAIQRHHDQNRLGFLFQLPSGSIINMHNRRLFVKMSVELSKGNACCGAAQKVGGGFSG